MAAGVRVFSACSLDGFIAGPDGDLSWLPEPDAGGEDYGFGTFLAETAAILMGRTTYDTAARFDDWPYREIPVFVATSSSPTSPIRPARVPSRRSRCAAGSAGTTAISSTGAQG